MAICAPWPAFEQPCSASSPAYVSGPKWLASYQDPGTREYASLQALRREVELGDPFGISCCASRGVDLNRVWADGCGPPVVEAAGRGHLLALRRLLDLGADATGKNAQGFTALMAACSRGHKHIVEELIGNCFGNSEKLRFILAADTKKSGVTAAKLAEQRLASAKTKRSTALEAMRSAAEQCTADSWRLHRKTFEDDVQEAEDDLARCENVCLQLDRAKQEATASTTRPAVTFDVSMPTAGTASILADEVQEDRTFEHQSSRTFREGSANSWTPLFNATVEEALPTRRGNISSLASPRQGYTSVFGSDSSAQEAVFGKCQKIPYSVGASLITRQINKATTQKKEVERKRKSYIPQTVPSVLAACRSLSVPSTPSNRFGRRAF